MNRQMFSTSRLLFKFIDKKDMPEDFRNEALKICGKIKKDSGSKGVNESVWRGVLINLHNAQKKIRNGNLKNHYILVFKYKDITTAAGVRRKNTGCSDYRL